MDRAVKPADVFDRDDEWEDLVSFVTDPAGGPRLGVVWGRRRQGKTYLLGALCEAMGGLHLEATEATAAESRRRIGVAVAAYTGAPGPIDFPDWSALVDALLDLPATSPLPVVIDEFPYLARVSPELPSIIQAAFDARRRRGGPPVRLLLCGSALTFMGNLLAGNAPLRGRAGLELVVPPLDYRLAARFWDLTDPRLAVLTHSVVGGTPAYRREYARDDTPRSLADFGPWVERTVLSPASPLFREARYLLAEEPDLRDMALYHSVLAAVADGNATRGGIASYVGRKATEISHPLSVLENTGLLAKEPDVLREARPLYRITEPLIAFYQAVMRPAWRDLERRRAAAVWQRSRARFASAVAGPHFESLCRAWARDFASLRTFGDVPGEVGFGVVTDAERHTGYEVDVVVLSVPDGRPRRVLSLGEAKWGEPMGLGHLGRLARVRDLLGRRGYETAGTRLACYGGAGFSPDLVRAAGLGEVTLVGPERLYSGS